MLMMVGGAITAVVLIVSLSISFILCFKKKTVDSTDSLSDLKHSDISKVTGGSGAVMTAPHFLSVGDAGSSGTGSDMKAEIRTSSSMSERREWVDGGGVANEMAQVVENIYNYTQQQQQQLQQERFYATSSKIVSTFMLTSYK